MSKYAVLLLAIMSSQAVGATEWYVGAQIGSAETDVGNQTFDQAVSGTGVMVTSSNLDKRDTAAELFVGYRFSSHVSVELGYLDLGERSVSFQGQVNVDQEQAFLARVAQVYPTSGDGVTAAVNIAMPIGEQFSIEGRLGLFDWSGDFRSINGQTQTGAGKASDTDFFYGLRFNYHAGQRLRLFAGYGEYDLGGHDNSMWSVGASYGF